MIDSRVVNRAYQGILVTQTSHPRKDLTDLNSIGLRGNWLIGTANLGRSFGLHVPRVYLAGSSYQKKENAVLIRLGVYCTLSLERKEAAETQSNERQASNVQEITTVQTVTKSNRAIGIDPKHYGSSLTQALENMTEGHLRRPFRKSPLFSEKCQ
jgi:hypothetical protein